VGPAYCPSLFYSISPKPIFVIFPLPRKRKIGSWIVMVHMLYGHLMGRQFSWRPLLDDLFFDSFSVVEAFWLERDFEEGEVLEVVKAMNGDKASRLDGFYMAFFQACWSVLKGDTMKVFCEFQVSGKFERSLNATFIALISKIPGAGDPKDFRPSVW
jgi:hypothetical protein